MAEFGPLRGVRVLELGQYVAGSFCARLLAEFGAEVIKVESPDTGDALRRWRAMAGDTSLWWYLQARNKKSLTLNLKHPEGQALIRQLCTHADILVENFRPGTLENWGLGWNELHDLNPRLVMVRISGFGQDGPYRDRPGFGSIGEAMGGIRHVTGYPELPPTRAGISLGDSLAGLYGALGALMALHNRNANGGRGQMVDAALYESVFGLMESIVPEYDRFGIVRGRTGNSLPGITPTNLYPSSDGHFIAIAANGDSVFRRFMMAIGRADLAQDPGLQENDGRTARAEELDRIIGDWARTHTAADILAICHESEVPAGRIYTVADMVADEHFLAREMIRTDHIPDGPVKMPGIVPKLNDTPGHVTWVGPQLGQHTEEILSGLLGLSADEIMRLRADKVV